MSMYEYIKDANKVVKESVDEDARKFVKETTLKKDLKSKKGFEIKAGDKVTVKFAEKDGKMYPGTVAIYPMNDKDNRILLHTTNASKYLKGFTAEPSQNQIEKMVDDGIATTITGKRTEPDGLGDDYSPSWLLVLGLI